MKAYTDIEQSKKLAEFLSIESTDMCYPLPCEDEDKPLLEQGGFGSTPCWSLAALLDVLPTGKILLHDKGNHGYKCICNNIDSNYFNNPVDACVEMILKLHERNLL